MKTNTTLNLLNLLILLLAMLSVPAGIAGQPGGVTLAWNPSVSTNITAYKIYAWTNCPDTNCIPTNAVQTLMVGNVTNATLNFLVPADYTFAATAVDTNTSAESQFSNFAYYKVPAGPTYFITVQSSTNLLVWSNTPVFFRLQIHESL